MARLRRDREPAQFFVFGVAEPGNQGVARAGAQHLLRRPKRVQPAGRAHYGKVGQIDAGRRQRGRVG